MMVTARTLITWLGNRPWMDVFDAASAILKRRSQKAQHLSWARLSFSGIRPDGPPGLRLSPNAFRVDSVSRGEFDRLCCSIDSSHARPPPQVSEIANRTHEEGAQHQNPTRLRAWSEASMLVERHRPSLYAQARSRVRRGVVRTHLMLVLVVEDRRGQLFELRHRRSAVVAEIEERPWSLRITRTCSESSELTTRGLWVVSTNCSFGKASRRSVTIRDRQFGWRCMSISSMSTIPSSTQQPPLPGDD